VVQNNGSYVDTSTLLIPRVYVIALGLEDHPNFSIGSVSVGTQDDAISELNIVNNVNNNNNNVNSRNARRGKATFAAQDNQSVPRPDQADENTSDSELDLDEIVDFPDTQPVSGNETDYQAAIRADAEFDSYEFNPDE
jgi:hypothetical protein